MNLAVLGAQWGDEGKGKIVDLADSAVSTSSRDIRAGTTPAHRLCTGTEVRAPPDSVRHPAPGVTCVIGNGVVVDPQALSPEVDELAEDAASSVGRLSRERRRAPDPAVSPGSRPAVGGAPGERKIGTTSRGIGPATRTRSRAAACASAILPTPGALEQGVRDNVSARNRASCPTRNGVEAGAATSWSQADRCLRPWLPTTSRWCWPGDGEGQVRSLRGRTRHVARHRSRNVSVRDLRPTPRSAASAPASASARAPSTASSAS